ncbi:MAG: endonuclease/exonuclease/phosphatase family protein, partial [Flavobacteriaceae bacterium]
MVTTLKNLQIALIMGILALPIPLSSQSTKVMTYNIKYDNVSDTVNNWNDRKEAMVDQLKKHDPGIIGMQEVLYGQLEYLDESLPDFEYVGVGRDDGKQKGEFSPILYNSKKFALLRSNTFWLSKTPEKVSVGWDAALERICTYALFEDKNSGQ